MDTASGGGTVTSATEHAITTLSGFAGGYRGAALTTTGEVDVKAGSTIREVCDLRGSSKSVNFFSNPAMTATRLSSKSGGDEITRKRPEQKFTPPRLTKH
jgi:hypothetical protein